MSRKTPMGGEYGYSYSPTNHGRNLFLAAINRCVPEVLEQLVSTVYPVFVKEQELAYKTQSPYELTSYFWHTSYSSDLNLHASLRVALDTWANSFNIGWKAFHSNNRGSSNAYFLGDDWVALQAMWGMWQWWKNPSMPKAVVGTGSTVEIYEEHEINTIAFDCKFEHYVKSESLKDFKKRVFSQLEEAFDKQVTDFAHEAESFGLLKNPNGKPELPKHMEWLALWQIKGMTHQEICEWWTEQKGVQVDESTVSKAIRDAASLIGLKLRDRNKGGRPKNS